MTMTFNPSSAKLTIFEGPDGAGKTTAAIKFAEETGARYVHFGPLSLVDKGLPRLYVEAMVPALLGYQDVVFDRSWLSEIPYGTAFREGKDRIGLASRRMLERISLRCATVVVKCQPPWETVVANYSSRKGIEMLENENQLHQVYELYAGGRTHLPSVLYDYTSHPKFFSERELDKLRTHPHAIDVVSAGNLDGKVALIGEKFAERKDQDGWHQYPFVSFCRQGCSQWLAEQLDNIGYGEDKILWVNSDQDLAFLTTKLHQCKKIFALGSEAAHKVQAIGLRYRRVPHPQSWKRFNAAEAYPLLDYLKGLA